MGSRLKNHPVPRNNEQIAEIRMKFPNTGHLCLLLGVTEVALVSANSNVLMLDSRNLRPEKEHFGHG